MARIGIVAVAALLTAAIGLSLPGLLPDEQSGPPPAAAVGELGEIGAAETALAAATADFGFRLYQAVRQSADEANLFVSPASVAIALAMTYGGAAGETQAAMAETMAITGLSADELSRAHATLAQHLAAPDLGAELTIANSLWARQGLPFRPEFLQRNQTYFGAEVAELDFDDPAAAATINDWVKRQTRGLIAEIVGPQIDPDTILFLLNAIYFKGEWQVAFDPAATQPRLFTRADGSQVEHPLMEQKGKFSYLQTDDFAAVALPYGEDGRVRMIVFLPHAGADLDGFVAGLDADSWQQWLGRMHAREGTVVLPRFKVESDLSLRRALSALGMAVAFDEGQADFDAMLPTPAGINVFLKDVRHKTFVEVDEVGTEAAAVTSVEVGVTSAPLDGPFSFIADRPFFFAIADEATGLLLFLGELGAPE